MSYSPETLKALIEDQTKFVWEIPEFQTYNRSVWWYVIVSLIAIGAVIYGIYSLNYLFSLIILISTLILLIAANEKPKKILFQIGNTGIVIDGRFIEFSNIYNFSIIYQPPFIKILYIELKNPIKPRLRIPLETQDPIVIREHLLNYVEENLDLRDEHFSDILGHILKI